MGRFSLAIIIPAYNEASTIGQVVQAVSAYGQAIVVNDASSDETAAIALQQGAEVVHHITNRGYDGALQSGLEKASALGFTHALTFDADGQHDANLIDAFIQELQRGSAMVVGIRPEKARIAESIFSVYTHLRFGIKDPLCGMKAYDLTLVKEKKSFGSYPSIGTELMLSALKKKCLFSQIKIPINPRQDASRLGNNFRANYKILCAMIYGMFL